VAHVRSDIPVVTHPYSVKTLEKAKALSPPTSSFILSASTTGIWIVPVYICCISCISFVICGALCRLWLNYWRNVVVKSLENLWENKISLLPSTDKAVRPVWATWQRDKHAVKPLELLNVVFGFLVGIHYKQCDCCIKVAVVVILKLIENLCMTLPLQNSGYGPCPPLQFPGKEKEEEMEMGNGIARKKEWEQTGRGEGWRALSLHREQLLLSVMVAATVKLSSVHPQDVATPCSFSAASAMSHHRYRQ